MYYPREEASLRRVSVAIFAATIIVVLSACKRTPSEPNKIPPLQVNVISAVGKDITEWIEFPGRMDAVESVEIRPRVSGYLTEVHFKGGDMVEKGAPLFTIDPRPYQLEYDRAVAGLEHAEVQEKLAVVEYERAEKLVQSRAIAVADFDQKAAALRQARAGIRVAEVAKSEAALNLEFTQIKSPIDGRVSDARVTLGNLVQAGVTTQGVLTTVVSVDPLYVYVDADENTLLRLMEMRTDGKRTSVREGQTPAYVELANEENFPHEGYLDFVDNRLDPSTGTRRARGVFRSWDTLLAPGFFVRMRVPSGPPGPAVLLPDEVISSQQGVRFVYVVKPDDTLERRNLQVGTLDDGLRVVRSGVKAGERVVSTRLQMLRPGMQVQPLSPPAPPASPSAVDEK